MKNRNEIITSIKTVASNDKTMRDTIQSCLIDIAAHVYVHGDVTLYDRLFEAARASNRKAMIKWVYEYGFARFDHKAGTFKVNATQRKEAVFIDGDEVVDYLTSQRPWYESVESVQQVASSLDIAKRLESLARQIDKAKSEGRQITFGNVKDSLDTLVESIQRAA